LGRRRFLTSLGAGTVAFAVLGVSACSSSADEASGTTSTTDPDAAPSTTAGGDDGGDDAADADADGDIDDVEANGVRWQQVSFGFVSAYLLQRGREIAVVDTGTEGGAEQIEAGLAALGADWTDIRHVILTHSHGDHVGGLDVVLENAPAASAHAGTADLESISTTDPDGINGLDDGDEIFGLRVIGTPGHTPGHIAVFDEASGLLVAGDALNAEDGRLTGANPRFTPDMDEANASIQKLARRDVETVLMGHSDPVTGAGSLLVDLARSL
jgi:glyoxylase-like metal-dependent hydrolase (beta-lactamase superfamily II)